MKLHTIAAALTTALLLAACGGGGSDNAVVDPVAAATAWQNLYSGNRQWALTGTGSDNLAYTLNLALVSGGAQTFPLTGAATTVRYWDSTLTATGQLPATGRTAYYLDPASLVLAGTQNVTSGACAQVTNSVLPPASTAVGTSGVQAQLTGYVGCTPNPLSGVTGVMRWAVAQELGVSYLCSSVLQSDTIGGSVYEEDCFETTPQGQIGSRARVYIQIKTTTTVWSLQLRTP
ncbi:MAG: hypothetical protein LCH73_05210 [Proteobacteria bacterium]|nr:hypothetical protein [Pseudomonadota bacterium]